MITLVLYDKIGIISQITFASYSHSTQIPPNPISGQIFLSPPIPEQNVFSPHFCPKLVAHPKIKRTPLGVFLASTLNEKKVSIIIDTTLIEYTFNTRLIQYSLDTIVFIHNKKIIINEYQIFNEKKVILMTQLSVIRDTPLRKLVCTPQIKSTPLGVFSASTLNDKKVIVMTIVSVIIDTTLSRLGEFSRYFR